MIFLYDNSKKMVKVAKRVVFFCMMSCSLNCAMNPSQDEFEKSLVEPTDFFAIASLYPPIVTSPSSFFQQPEDLFVSTDVDLTLLRDELTDAVKELFQSPQQQSVLLSRQETKKINRKRKQCVLAQTIHEQPSSSMVEKQVDGKAQKVKKYICQVPGCGSDFCVPSDLKRHNKIHQKKEYCCFECFEDFADKINFEKHVLRWHRPDLKPFMCMECKKLKAFVRPDTLKNHLRIKHGITDLIISANREKIRQLKQYIKKNMQQVSA